MAIPANAAQEEAIRVRDSSGAVFLVNNGASLITKGHDAKATKQEHGRLTDIVSSTLRTADKERERVLAERALDPAVPATMNDGLRRSLDYYLSMPIPTLLLLHWRERGLFDSGVPMDTVTKFILERYQPEDPIAELLRPHCLDTTGDDRCRDWPTQKSAQALLPRRPQAFSTLLDSVNALFHNPSTSYAAAADVVAHDLAYCIQSGLFEVAPRPEGRVHVRVWPQQDFFFRNESLDNHTGATFRLYEQHGFMHTNSYFTNLINLFVAYLQEAGTRITSMRLSDTHVTDDLRVPDTVHALNIQICKNIRGTIDLNKPSLERLDFSPEWLDVPFPRLPIHLQERMDPVIEGLVWGRVKRDDHRNSLSALLDKHREEVLGITSCRTIEDIYSPFQQTIATPVEATKGLVERLLEAGIPEQAIEQNKDLWSFIQSVERDAIVSANRVFSVTDRDGKAWKLKITSNKQKAYVEAAANYYLSSRFDFIVPGAFSKPLEANGLYLTMQEDVSDKSIAVRPLEYWIHAYALFHRDAEAILREANIVIPDAIRHSVGEYHEQYAQGREHHDFPFDWGRLRESIAYLQRPDSPKTVIHRDGKPGNIVGPYMVDLEDIAVGEPAIDLAMAFTRFAVPEEQWGGYLAQYLSARDGVPVSVDDANVRQLQRGVREAVIYTAYKELLGSSLRRITPETRAQNATLVQQLYGLAA